MLVFIKLWITFSISVYILYVMFVQHFELQGRPLQISIIITTYDWSLSCATEGSCLTIMQVAAAKQSIQNNIPVEKPRIRVVRARREALVLCVVCLCCRIYPWLRSRCPKMDWTASRLLQNARRCLSWQTLRERRTTSFTGQRHASLDRRSSWGASKINRYRMW